MKYDEDSIASVHSPLSSVQLRVRLRYLVTYMINFLIVKIVFYYSEMKVIYVYTKSISLLNIIGWYLIWNRLISY